MFSGRGGLQRAGRLSWLEVHGGFPFKFPIHWSMERLADVFCFFLGVFKTKTRIIDLMT